MNEIAIDKDRYEELMALSRWYEAMPPKAETPNFYAGDSFHEKFNDFRSDCIPVDVESIINDEDHYNGGFELTDEGLFVIVVDVNTNEEELWKIVPKG